MVVYDGSGYSLALHTENTTPHESQLVEETLRNRFIGKLPPGIIGDMAYDSNQLDEELKNNYGIELIAQNRRDTRKIQDGRSLRRYRKRWQIERLFSWIQRFRHVVNRWEYKADNFLAMLHLACSIILLRLF